MLLVAWLFSGWVIAERLPIRIYTSADGLASSAVFNMVRDARGFIWLCTRDGLVRFDGYRFITYRVGDSDADPTVFDLQPTRNGFYWVNLNRGTDYLFTQRAEDRLLQPSTRGGSTLDPRLTIEAQPITEAPLPTFEDEDGNIWTANNKGIFRMLEQNGQFSLEHSEISLPRSPRKELVTASFAESVGPGFWVGTQWGLVKYIPGAGQVHFSVNPHNGEDTVLFFSEDKRNRVWIARPNGIVVLNTGVVRTGDMSGRTAIMKEGEIDSTGGAVLPETSGHAVSFTFDQLLMSFAPERRSAADFVRPVVHRIICGSDGKVWITTNHGLLMYDGQRFRHYTSEHGLAANVISAILEDGDGYIWFATYGGLHRVNPNGLVTFAEADGLETDRVHAIYENAAGELQVVSGNFNFSARRDGRFVRVRPRLPAGSTYSWQSNTGYLDSRGDWWLLTTDRVFRFSDVSRIEDLNNKPADQTFTRGIDLPSGTNLRVFEDPSGNIWTSSYSAGSGWALVMMDRETGKFTQFSEKDGLPSAPAATAMVPDSSGQLWFGFVEGGLARYRDGRFSLIDSPGAPKNAVTAIHRDAAGRMWVASSREGLFRVDKPEDRAPEFHRYSITDGLTSDNVRCITDDREGNIYIGTVRGVNRLHPGSGQIKYYGTADGLASDFVNTAFRDKDGVLWFGTHNGLSRLEPHPDEQHEPKDILITGLRIAGEEYDVSPIGQKNVFVPDQQAGRNNVQIEFLSVRTGADSDMRYQYMIEGADKDWSPPTTERTVNIANLPAGSHRFVVRSVTAAGLESRGLAAVHFTILRPIWQRWWFLLFAAFALAAVIYFVYRYRLEQLIKLERVRTRIATDLHDDIGSSLSQIAILSEVVRQKVGDNGAARPLGAIADTSREMVDSMSDIVWAINPERDRLSDLVHRIRRFAEDITEAQGIELNFHAPEKMQSLHLDSDVRREVYLFLKEAINNLVKHSESRTAEIDLMVKGSLLLMTVADDGVGFDPTGSVDASEPGGNGIVNMRRRIERLGGKLEIDSAPGSGTRLRIEIPLRGLGVWDSVKSLFRSGIGKQD